jgi:hypothetical protein
MPRATAFLRECLHSSGIETRMARKDLAMEQVPHWLEVTVFAAGMTAYAEEVDGTLHRAPPIAGDAGDPEAPPPSAIH